ncbi:uncharacterized protein Ir20a [Drosophila kikkawai]|uniref:Uncharacterized protein Ir20a n=1 Tax=Drosophila kikkawai TaxID=30033 RepID=A0A6P4ILT6_DROKI|nr:uncharacterized protein LOC108079928 [Drosophila kikkawai]
MLAQELLDLYGLVMGFLAGGVTTMIYYNPAGLDCSWNVLWRSNLTHQPQIVWQNGNPCPDLYNQFNGDILVLACLSPGSMGELHLRNLASSLRHLMAVPVLVEVVAQDRKALASEYLSICLHRHLLNVELYFRDHQKSLILYSYQAFPHFRLIQRSLSDILKTQIFGNKLGNLRGHRLRVLPDLSPPNTFDYRDERGQLQVAGYLWDFIVTYASQRNASLEVIRPGWRPGGAADSTYMLELTRNGTMDFGLTTAFITKRNVNLLHQYTYPILFSSWCTMLPVEKPIPKDDLFGRIMCPGAVVLLLAILLLGYLAFACMDSVRNCAWLRILPRLMALILLTTSTAQLLSLLISPPPHKRIENFDDLLSSSVRILGMSNEFYDMDGVFRAKYAAAFHLISDPDELYELRNHFNSSWAYTIALIKWHVIEQQQHYFSRPLFRLSTDLCFNDYVPTSFVLAPDSIYYESLKDFTLSAAQAGLMKHWIAKSFYDMVASGRMDIRDYSEQVVQQPLSMVDLRHTWLIFGAAIAVASGVFLLELSLFHVNVFLNSI